MKIIRNKAFLVCSILFLMIAVSGIGVFTYSYFTDRTENSELATAGTVDIELDTVRESNLDKVGIDLKNNVRQDILNPGDLRQASFGVYNKGNKSVDVRNTIVINSTKEFSEVDGKYEFELYDKDAFEYRDNGAIIGLKEGASPVGERVLSDDKKTITYTLPDTVLNGNEDLDEREVEEGIDSDSIVYDYKLVFRDDADNDFQGSIITISVISEAKQHRNTSAGWEIVTHDTVSFDDLEYSLAENNGYGLTEISVNDWTIAKYNYDSTPMVYENTVKYTDNQIVEENKKQYVLTEFEGLYGKKKGNQTYLDTETGNLVSITYQEDGNTYTKMKKTEYPNRKLSESQYNGQPVYITGEFTYEEGLITDSGILHKTMTISGSLNEYINGDVVISTDNYIEKGNSVYDDLSCDAPDIMNQKGIHISMYQDSLNGKYLGEIIMNEDRDGFMAIGEKYSPYPNNKFGAMKIADGEDYAYYILIFYDYTDEEIGNFPGKYAVIQYYQDSVRSKNKLGSIYVDISELNNLDQYLDQFRPDGYYSGINITDIPTSSINAKTGLLACTVLYTKDYEQQVDPIGNGYFTDYEIESTTGKVGIVEGDALMSPNGAFQNITINNRGNKSVYVTDVFADISIPSNLISDPNNIAIYNSDEVEINAEGKIEIPEDATPLDIVWEKEGENHIFTTRLCDTFALNGSSEYAEFEKVPAYDLESGITDSKQISVCIVDKTNTVKNANMSVRQVLKQYENSGSFFDEFESFDMPISLPEIVIPHVEIYEFSYYESDEAGEGYLCEGFTVDGNSMIQTGTLSSDIVIPDTYDDGEHGVLPVIGIDSGAFSSNTYITSVQLPESTKLLRSNAFSWCSNLSAINIPDGCYGIGSSALARCNLTSITLPSSFTGNTITEHSSTHGTYSLTANNCLEINRQLTEVNLPNTLEVLPSMFFRTCSSIETIDLPDTLKEIGRGAFQTCSGLKSITIPQSVENIGIEAFVGCNSLKTVNFYGSSEILNRTFAMCTSLDTIVIPDGVKDLTGTFIGCTSLKDIEISNTVNQLSGTFDGCSALETIFIPNSVSDTFNLSISNESFVPSGYYSVFGNCESLKEVIIDNTKDNLSVSVPTGCTITYLR